MTGYWRLCRALLLLLGTGDLCGTLGERRGQHLRDHDHVKEGQKLLWRCPGGMWGYVGVYVGIWGIWVYGGHCHTYGQPGHCHAYGQHAAALASRRPAHPLVSSALGLEPGSDWQAYMVFSVYVALTYIPVGDSADRVCDDF